MIQNFFLVAFIFLAACQPADKNLTFFDDLQSNTSASFSKALPSEFNSPWAVRETAIVIDAYQGNSIDWNKMASDPKVVAVIHRSSMGLKRDIAYSEREKIAKQRGYLWGAYHLGTSENPIEQAQFFLNIIGNDSQTLMILDLEDLGSASMMNAANAIKFLKYVFEKTGRIPIIYANHQVTKILNSQFAGSEILKASRLWYARFRRHIPDFPAGIWSSYFLWQFSSEINCQRTNTCLYNVPGTEFDMDINVFYGSKEQLASQWQ